MMVSKKGLTRAAVALFAMVATLSPMAPASAQESCAGPTPDVWTPPTDVVAVGGWNIRRVPEAGRCDTGINVDHGQAAVILGRTGDWVFVETDAGTRGWVHGDAFAGSGVQGSSVAVENPRQADLAASMGRTSCSGPTPERWTRPVTVVAEGTWNVRMVPEVRCDTFVNFVDGESATLIGVSGDWSFIETSRIRGWVHSESYSSTNGAGSNASASAASAVAAVGAAVANATVSESDASMWLTADEWLSIGVPDEGMAISLSDRTATAAGCATGLAPLKKIPMGSKLAQDAWKQHVSNMEMKEADRVIQEIEDMPYPIRNKFERNPALVGLWVVAGDCVEQVNQLAADYRNYIQSAMVDESGWTVMDEFICHFNPMCGWRPS